MGDAAHKAREWAEKSEVLSAEKPTGPTIGFDSRMSDAVLMSKMWAQVALAEATERKDQRE